MRQQSYRKSLIIVALAMPLLISGVAGQQPSASAAILPVEVSRAPEFYQTGWFYCLCGAALLLVGYAICRLQMRQLKERERRLAERVAAHRQEVEQVERKYRTLFNQIADPVLIFDRETYRILDFNDGVMRVYDYSAEELRAMTPFDLHPAEDRALVELSIDIRNLDQPFTYTHVSKYGRRIAVEVLTNETTYEGRPAWITVVRDVTERKEAEEKLRLSNQRFELVASGSNDGIWDWNILTDEFYLSPRLKELLGYREEEIKVSTWSSLLPPEDQARVQAAVQAHLKHKTPYDIEFRVRARDGSYRWFRSRGQAVWDEYGTATRMAGSITDLTDRKQAEGELTDYATRLARTNQEWQDFAFIASQDLQEPLRKVITFGERLKVVCQETLGETGHDYLERMQKASARMQRLISDLTDWSGVTIQAQPFAPVD